MPSSPNLVSLISQFITPDMLGRIASSLGVDRAAVQKAVGAGIPGILAALISTVSKPGGAARVENAVDQQEPGLLATAARMMGTPQQATVAEEGLGALSSLLGGNTTSTLATALNRYAGIGDNGAKGLLGLLTPAIMGVLGQQSTGPGGVAQLLASQKDNIVRALPSGFASYLSGTGVLENVTTTATNQASRGRSSYSAERSSGNWLLPVLAALALLGLGWYLMSGTSRHDRVATTPPATQTDTRNQTARVGGAPFVVAQKDLASWTHKPIYSSDNKKVGEITELVRTPEDKVTDIYMDAETTLGIGGQRYHVSADKVSEVKPDGIVLSMTEAEVKAMPGAAGQAKTTP
ncbi:MAG TPA: DUF937 domain-containing protein [Hyphomicrobium sp.]|nr:DUF937 domain-containing protein [Hyphomicrobium sp.]